MSSSSTYSSRVLRARGTEAPEGTMWASQANHFFNYCGHRVSRSMVEKAGHDSLGVYGNHCDKRIFNTPEPRPTRIPTWAESEREEIQVERRYPSSSSSSGSTTAVNTPATELNAFLDDRGKGKGADVESVSARFKLEEHIPLKHLPDILVVHDPQGCASFQGDRSSYETRYRLVTGKPKNSPPSTAFLRFSSHRLPSAKNCKLHRASIRLPGSNQELSIMAKLAAGSNLTDARNMLECEASMYATRLPSFLSEDWTGYHYIREAEYDGDGILPVSAVVPKFYGYYVPESRVDTMLLSPILLFEDCGSPVDIARLKQKERETIFSFWHRLHRLNIAHGSISSYSVMVQPGPWTGILSSARCLRRAFG
ncbi:hypothetical protein BDZ89DRAFT_1156994 [Hymenopellis radicata]|nr:hypothetical protein BDZ89DRAFT_1156994 [Hymenopellis radicata]